MIFRRGYQYVQIVTSSAIDLGITFSPEEDQQYAAKTLWSTSHVTTSWDKQKTQLLLLWNSGKTINTWSRFRILIVLQPMLFGNKDMQSNYKTPS